MKGKFILIGCWFAVLLISTGCAGKRNDDILCPENLRCEYLTNPSGIDVTTPQLSFCSTSKQRDQRQTAYRILVSSSLEKLDSNEGDLWDSKKVKSDQSIHIIYKGKELHSEDECFWKVKVWNGEGKESAWSEPAKWSMGLLNKTDWKGYWIGLDSLVGNDKQFSLSARYLRKEFAAAKKVKRATAYICGLGLFELYINGNKIGDQVLAPALSEYPKRSYYMTFDVTKEIDEGQNAVGVILGSGRYFAACKWDRNFGFPKMIFQLNIEFADGSRQSIVSDTSWKITTNGPIVISNKYNGEEYDARKEMPGWNNVGFDDSRWMNPEKLPDATEKLSSQMIEPTKIIETIKPQSITEIRPEVYIIDMGQNMTGWIPVKVRADSGTKIKMRFAEILNSAGELDMAGLRSAKQTDVYIAKGSGLEEWEPYFAYHGFRYVELTGYPGKPDLNTIVGKVVHDDIRTIGHFNCSNDIINKIYKASYWGYRGNYHSIPTACSQRDERDGWLGDRSINSYSESFIFDNNAIYSKWMTDISDAQKATGSISDVCPTTRIVYGDNVTWPSTFIMVHNFLYEQFGNLKVIADNYDAMKKWLFYMRDKYMKDYLLPRDSYGDWCMPPEDRNVIHSKDSTLNTPGDFLGSAYFYYDLILMERYARLLNKDEDAKEFSSLSEKVREAVNKRWLNRENFYYANNTVTANAVALSFGLPPDEIRSKVFENLVDKTVNVFDYHTSCGIIGQQWLMKTLTDNGRVDMALRIAANTTYPSFGYMLGKGATTIWELWNGDSAPPTMNSHNLVMLIGDFVVWLYENLAGIKSDPVNPGFKNIIMKPIPVEGLDYVHSEYHSIHGLIKSSWKKEGKSFIWDITVPCNTTATVYIAAPSEKEVTESGKKVSSAKGVKYIRIENGYAVYKVGSGNYHFVVE
jgi:Alpha-L-rhamnosidase N-terminal domain./Bacterial alpha-L-rhamnosidase.